MGRWFKHDLRYLVSALLLMLTALVAVTGAIADLWDLNDFALHTFPGYAMAALALVHTGLEFPRIMGYLRGRLRRARRREDRAAEALETSATAESRVKQTLDSRRGVLGLLFGGISGFFLGRAVSLPEDGLGEADLGFRYHEWSKADASTMVEGLTDWGGRPKPYKTYPDADRVRLPPPVLESDLGTLAAIEQRRSIRGYPGEPMTLDELSTLLYSSDGINLERGGLALRASPSAGALYPIEIYVIAHSVAGMAPGLYHYALRDHALERLRSGELRQESRRLGVMQGFLGEADAVFVLTAIFQRLRWRYRRRSYRYALLEAGHIGQNVYLASTATGFGACAVGAFLDGGLNRLLGVDGRDEAALYMIPVGRV